MTDALAKYRKPKTRKGGTCCMCGGASNARVAVTLMERERVPSRTSKDANAVRWPAVDSSSRTFCETHAVEIYEAAKAELERLS